jgi:hypothetical protein
MTLIVDPCFEATLPSIEAAYKWAPDKTKVLEFHSGAVLCARAYSSKPWYVQIAKKDPEYWLQFYASRPNSYSRSGHNYFREPMT